MNEYVPSNVLAVIIGGTSTSKQAVPGEVVSCNQPLPGVQPKVTFTVLRLKVMADEYPHP